MNKYIEEYKLTKTYVRQISIFVILMTIVLLIAIPFAYVKDNPELFENQNVNNMG